MTIEEINQRLANIESDIKDLKDKVSLTEVLILLEELKKSISNTDSKVVKIRADIEEIKDVVNPPKKYKDIEYD